MRLVLHDMPVYGHQRFSVSGTRYVRRAEYIRGSILRLTTQTIPFQGDQLSGCGQRDTGHASAVLVAGYSCR